MSRPLTSRPGSLEWDKEGDGGRTIRASDELPTGVTLSSPTAEVQRLTIGSEPEEWNTETTVTVSAVQVVNSVANDGETILGVDQAVQFQLDADGGPLPDPTDTPLPGDNYRVVATAERSDGTADWVGKVPLIIHH